MTYIINDRRNVEKKGLGGPEGPLYPSLNSTYTQFTQIGAGRNSSSLGNYDKNRSILNFVSWLYIFADQNSARMAGAKLGLFVPKPEDGFSTKRAMKALNLSDRLHKKALSTGEEFLLVTDKDHPIISMLDQPNPIQNSYTFFYKIYAYLQLAGQAPVLKIRDEAGNMTGMVTLDPRTVKPIRNYAVDPWAISDYIYIGANGLNHPIAVNDLIWIAYPSLASYTETWCPAAAAWNDICLSAEKTNADVSYSINRMRPDFIAACKNVDQGEMERISAQIEDKLRGSSNTGQMLFLNSEQVQLEPMQNFDGYVAGDPDALIRKLCSYFKYPYAKYMSTESNRATVNTIMSEWAKDLQPTMGLVQDALCKAFREEFPDLDTDAELEYESIDVKDDDIEMKKYGEMWRTGAIDRYTYKTAMGLKATDADIDVYVSVRAPAGAQIAEDPTPNKQGA